MKNLIQNSQSTEIVPESNDKEVLSPKKFKRRSLMPSPSFSKVKSLKPLLITPNMKRELKKKEDN